MHEFSDRTRSNYYKDDRGQGSVEYSSTEYRVK
jgi:hypothetical protein